MNNHFLTKSGRKSLILILAACVASCTDQSPMGKDIQLNQIGFLPGGAKSAVITGNAKSFSVVDVNSGKTVFKGESGPARSWAASGETVRIAEFSDLRTQGIYRLEAGGEVSPLFRIREDIYAEIGSAALKAFYFNRASTGLEAAFADIYARPLGHPDTQVAIHASAASASRPAGSLISSPKGWYDAGDYNKYIVNSAITVSTLMSLYEHYPRQAVSIASNIPESGNSVPDLLDEVRWNLDWMLSMQDPEDGGVYHKLTNLNFEDFVTPEAAVKPRFVVMKTTSASLDFAASMAQASRVYRPFDAPFADVCLRAANQAWSWAQSHPDVVYEQPEDVQTGTYSQAKGAFDDERFWAATELAISRGETGPIQLPGGVQVPEWANPGALAVMDQLAIGGDMTLQPAFLALADSLLAMGDRIPYGVTNESFRWGSNSDFLNQALILTFAYRLTGEKAYREAAQTDFDWVLGRNPLGICFVTGFGSQSPQHIHHRPSESDGIAAPQPGWVAGGPNPGNQYDCGADAYPSPYPAMAYVDQLCSYATNEIAINWNAPLVYLAFALQSAP